MSTNTTVRPLRQSMIKDMTARNLGHHTQRSHIRASPAASGTAFFLRRAACVARPARCYSYNAPERVPSRARASAVRSTEYDRPMRQR
jgi:hypothetical protein